MNAQQRRRQQRRAPEGEGDPKAAPVADLP